MKLRCAAVIPRALALACLLLLVAATVAFAEGKPVQPGNATVDGFLPASGCGCHGPLVDQWSRSMHAKAITDPVFLAKAGEAQAEAGEEIARFCKRCHSPIGDMTGDFDAKGSQVAAEGVTCMYCHQVVGVDAKPSNTSHLIEASQTRRAQLKDPQAPHAAVYSELHSKAEFCGGCHDVDHPTNGTHLETSYTEWAASPYAAEGVVCQECHMSSGAGVIGPASGTACTGGPQRENIYSMTFVGANVGRGPADASAALLKSAATVDLTIPEIVAAGSTASMTVTITNKGAGHYLPTGLTEVREMWLSVWVENADGSKTELAERRFGTVLKDKDGTAPSEMWNAVAVESDVRIPPRESVSSEYSFAMPAGADQAKVVAALYYRSVPDELAAKAGVQNPTTEMASTSRSVFVSEAARRVAARQDEDGGETRLPGLDLWIVVGGAPLLFAVAAGAFVLLKQKKA